MVLFQQVSFWLSSTALYIGFGVVMGILLKRTFSMPNQHPYWKLAIAHGFLFFIPASILLLSHQDWPIFGRFLLISIGLVVMVLSIIQPSWIPKMIWQRAFGQRYFTIALALITLWGISTIMTTSSYTPILIAIPACLVGVASWQSALRSS